MEKELSEALESMDKALDQANGTCAKKIRGRTIKVRMSLLSLLESRSESEGGK